jgi:acetyl esterase/lipase
VRSFPTPHWSGESTYVYQPTGTAKAPTGGTCGGPRRPTVLIAHGTGESDPATFGGLVAHLVSNGTVVVYPTHTMESSDPQSNDDAYHAVRDGFVAAVASTPRIDTRRLGVWGHSFGGGMTPYLVQQIAARGWGHQALWMSIVAQAYTRLASTKGTRAIKVPAWTREMTVSMEDDQLADNRLGIDVYESLTLPFPRKLYVRLATDAHGQPPIVADHTAPAGSSGSATLDAVDYALWRYADVLESCALFRHGCGPDLPPLGRWSDGTPVVPALVAYHPVDAGPAPALLAECDSAYGPILNADRLPYCGPTHV